MATTLFIDPDTEIDQKIYSALSDLGFRRSGKHLYRPHCQHCSACISTRIVVQDFIPKRRHRRIWKANRDLSVTITSDIRGAEYYALYERYIAERHSDGDMYPASREQYESFLSNEWKLTDYLVFNDNNGPVAVAVTDRLTSGLSAIYTFYDPSLNQRSLGVFAILWQIEQARRLDLPYVYLGYWIKQSQKMNYKIDYRPTQLLVNDNWLTLR